MAKAESQKLRPLKDCIVEHVSDKQQANSKKNGSSFSTLQPFYGQSTADGLEIF
jgi:hypothetical protein